MLSGEGTASSTEASGQIQETDRDDLEGEEGRINAEVGKSEGVTQKQAKDGPSGKSTATDENGPRFNNRPSQQQTPGRGAMEPKSAPCETDSPLVDGAGSSSRDSLVTGAPMASAQQPGISTKQTSAVGQAKKSKKRNCKVM